LFLQVLVKLMLPVRDRADTIEIVHACFYYYSTLNGVPTPENRSNRFGLKRSHDDVNATCKWVQKMGVSYRVRGQ